MLMQIEIRTGSLHESEERYALAARAANDGLWDWKLATGEIYFLPAGTKCSATRVRSCGLIRKKGLNGSTLRIAAG